MATGQGQSGGVFSWPDAPDLGPATWASMSGVRPESPLVGGRGAPTGGVDPDFKYHRTSISAAPDPTTAAATGMGAHWRELFNLRGNPTGWVLIAALLYFGLAHVSLQGSLRGRAGKAGAGISASAGAGK